MIPPRRARFVVKDMVRFLVLACAAMGTAQGTSAAQPRTTLADPVLLWNDQANRAIQMTGADPFFASRALAMESIAVFDTVRSISGAPGFLVHLPASSGLKPEIAIAAAAHTTLSHLFPSRRAELDEVFAASLAQEEAGPARAKSEAFGEAVADAVLAMRDRDGWKAGGEMRVGTAPGQWRPTPPAYQPPLDPQWATMVPFALTGPNQFRPAGPPALGSAAFRDATAAVATLGDVRSTARTAAQTEIARYWSDAIGTYAPAGHWNAITAELLASQTASLDNEVEVFAKLNVAMADAGIAIADAKYTYWFWRPITVIRTGGAGFAPIPDWTPLLNTPNHPTYISGHSGFSGAASVVLTDRFGTRGFSFVSASLPGVTRSFKNFQQAAEEAAASRMYGGIHFPFDNADGLATGRSIGAWTMAVFQHLGEDRGPAIVMDRPSSDLGVQELKGFALDSVTPIPAVMVQREGGELIRVPVDDKGRFTVPRQRLGQTAGRTVVVTAVSKGGRITMARQDIDSAGDGPITAPLIAK
jgi:membrane-associated phospholipid phosphatase